MKVTVSAVVLFGGLLVAAAGGQESAVPRAAPPTFPSDVEMVVVDVVVTAKGAGPLGGLTAEDFSVTEDGAPQQIVTFEAVDVAGLPAHEAAEPRPKVSVNTGLQAMNSRAFVLVFDEDHLSPLGLSRARTAVGEFLRFGPREGDTVMLVGTAGGSWWMTRAAEDNNGELGPVLQRLRGRHTTHDTPDRISDWEAMRIWEDRDPVALEQVRRRFETYITGRSRSAEGLPIRGQDRLTDLGSGIEWASDTEILNRAQEVYRQSVVRNRTTLTALARVLDSLGVVRGRKTLVLFSEGFIRDTRLEEYNAVVRAAQRSNVAVYFVDVRGLTAMPAAATAQFGAMLPAADVAEQMTQDLVSAEGPDTLAERTGGFSIKNTNDLERGLTRIAQEARRYYLLGYAPRDARRDGRWRKIAVKVNRPGVDVRARQGYYAPGPGKKGAERAAGTWRPGLQQAVDSPYEFQGIPVRLTDHVFGETQPGKARVLVTAEIDIRGLAYEEADARSLATLETLLVVVHRESGEFQQHDQKLELKLPREVRGSLERRWLPASRELELVPGGYRAKLVVRDKREGTLGSVSHEFEVPDLATWRMSTPILSDALEPRKEGAPLRLVVPARRAFMPGATLYFQFEVYGAAPDPASGLPRVSSGFALRSSEGAVVVHGPPAAIRPTPEGRLARIGVLPLEGLSPGRYELVLALRDDVAGRTLEVHEPFQVEPPAGL